MSKHIQLLDNFERLGLRRIQEYYPNYAELVNREGISFSDALLELTTRELEFRHHTKIQRMIEKAKFPTHRELKDFDFQFQPSIPKQEILSLESLGFMERTQNILFIGNSGVGKTHLAIAIGVEACRQNVKTLFINCHELIQKLQAAYQKGTLERVLKRYANYHLLIIDEIGYLPIAKQEANLLFQLIRLRYEAHSTIFTTNTPLSMWGEIFQDTAVTGAILDRLVHHSIRFQITGQSYRMKDYRESKELRMKEPITNKT
ncbi:IS21-like element helper ATPase IstB [Enterococcus saccharolyticus]|uniref:AAA+ ATPase domain-containing protein n=1 Tax=Enterococcus saccharolyticus subsp. saccharolyticus ATCC 43076 TaxID=1139996 RepID=S0JES5_9ENTE|nr:IS21-like element helper ATPase IstB [Enterococcus saccharolyticus]EOT26263.1 hypothetical protein OMQ_02312 [Enterococcus saccharolyticus subsp. saccharolyticus ATCC 43076]EOT82790.1 hypothetical protein I572_00330 [Enterococcus saccharolyticus subsp. saccharolyticus ATCC 43076]OJG91151.1 hypothetical protein RV16_GL000137 [Enterococcus saccharolyticus]